MKKVFAIALAALMIVGMFAGCGAKEPAPETTAAAADAAATTAAAEVELADMTIDQLKPLIKTITDGKLTMVTSPDFAPYEFYSIAEDGTPTLAGFDIALGQYIADFIGLELEVIPMDFDGTIAEIGAGKADIAMAGYSPDPKRANAMFFSDVYYTGGQSFVTSKANADKFPTLADANAAGMQIGAQLASIQEGLAKENCPDADVISLGKVTDIVGEVINNKLDGAFVETVVAEAYAKNYEDLVVLHPVPYDAEGSVVGVNKKNEALLCAVNLAIEAALADGSLNQFVAEANELASGNTHEGLLNADGTAGE